MSIPGQRFTLDLDADNWTFDTQDGERQASGQPLNLVKEIRERESSAPPPPPKPKSKTGFPQHRAPRHVSTFRQQRSQQQSRHTDPDLAPKSRVPPEPSDRAIINRIGQKHGIDLQAKEKADISEENRKKIAGMSTEEIEQARAEIMSNLNPAFIQRLLQRANIEEDERGQDWEAGQGDVPSSVRDSSARDDTRVRFQMSDEPQQNPAAVAGENENENNTADIGPTKSPGLSNPPTQSSIHFPVPPRNPDNFVALDPNSPAFINDLKTHYFPDTPHDPNALAWLQDLTEEENDASAYSSTQERYAPSDIRFNFRGRLLPPSEAETIPVSEGLHHHGEAPSSAGYTIPELAILVRSTLPNQRCIAYQTLGRILYRLGRGDYGARGSELVEGLWNCIEHERPVEVMMAEANRATGHTSARAHATEALWLWRKGGGGDRGVLKPSERRPR